MRLWRVALLATLLALSARAADPLAPAPGDLVAAADVLSQRLVRAEALAEATARIQNAWVTSGGPDRRGCSNPTDGDLASRGAAFGEAWRDASQAARAQARRVGAMLEAPTLTPLLDEAALARYRALLERADTNAHLYLEASAWHGRWLASVASRCGGDLRPAPGFSRAETLARGEERGATAIAGVGGGRICPLDVPADGRVVVVPDGKACVGSEGCACAPEDVQPGAVLGE